MTTAKSQKTRSKRELNKTLGDILSRQQAAFRNEKCVAYATRLDRINRCIDLLVDHRQQICRAVNEDFGNRSQHVTLMIDIYTSVMTLKHARKHLKKWMRPQRRKVAMPLNLFGARSAVHYQAKGVVGIMTPWNVPVNMIFSPLADVLAAGNRCMIKPSEFTPATAQLLQRLFANYFDETEIAVVTGDADTGAAFAALAFDHLIFTGSTSVGKRVMQAAAKNLTPVTLELGGKSPVVIGDSADIDDSAAKIMAGKAMNAGQLCINPDYAFVPASRLEAFIVRCKESIAELYPTIKDNPDYVAMINERHFQRVHAMLSDARDKGARVIELNPAAEDLSQQSGFKIPVHLIVNPQEECLCMQDEIFGPLLVIKTYTDINHAIQYINQKPHALAFYYFGKDKQEQQQVLNETTAGGVTVNDVMMHFSCDDLPFGGIGPSGMGNYHGIEGFKTFSHAKAVFKQGFVNLAKLAGTLPPYGESMDKMMASQIKK